MPWFHRPVTADEEDGTFGKYRLFFHATPAKADFVCTIDLLIKSYFPSADSKFPPGGTLYVSEADDPSAQDSSH
jgi:hypothetical protein